MKKRWKAFALAGLVALMVASMAGTALAAGGRGAPSGDSETRGAGQRSAAVSSAPAAPLSEAEEQAVLFMREEEKLARDVYLTLYDRWGVEEFENIAASESRHMAAVARLLDRRGLTDPVISDERGEFENEDLAEMYDDLVAQGLRSVEDAYKVGVAIEELDIADLEDLIVLTEQRDIDRVMQNLLRGSENHLAAFTKLLAE